MTDAERIAHDRRPRAAGGRVGAVRALAAGMALCAIAAVAPASAAAARAELDHCLGDRMPLVIDQQMPYAQVAVAGRRGHFVLDFGATVSSLRPAGFGPPGAPTPQPGTSDRYDGFEFFGPWGGVQLPVQTAAPRTARVRQAGILGTDFLAAHVFTLDYRQGVLWRARRGAFCSDAELSRAGLRRLPSEGYYAETPARLSCPAAGGPPRCVNVPTVPLRIGPLRTVAQLDTGYDDGRQPYSINVNPALLDALRRAGVGLVARPDIRLQLSTCVPGVGETVEAWQVRPGTPVGLEDDRGELIRVPRGRAVTLFVKRTPPAAAACGGIGTWPQPAAQLGASFLAGSLLAVDPFSSRVWMRPGDGRGR